MKIFRYVYELIYEFCRAAAEVFFLFALVCVFLEECDVSFSPASTLYGVPFSDVFIISISLCTLFLLVSSLLKRIRKKYCNCQEVDIKNENIINS